MKARSQTTIEKEKKTLAKYFSYICMGASHYLMLKVYDYDYIKSTIVFNFELITHLHVETHLHFAVKFWNMRRTLNTYDLIISRNV